jgi:hypothetical protein
LRASSTQHSPSSVSTMLGPEWFFKPYTKAYNTPSNGYSKCDGHWVFQCDHKLTTLPRVYSSRSCACPLFHPRNHALLLRESLALSRKSPGSSPPLTMGATSGGATEGQKGAIAPLTFFFFIIKILIY